MKKALLFFVLGGIGGAVAGSGAMLVAFPFLFPPAEVNETAPPQAELAGETRFREDSSGQDAGHWARGGIKIYRGEGGEMLAELQGDFEAGPGPNFWLYVNANSGVEDEGDFLADDGRIKIAKLKSFKGSQVYALTAEQFAAAKALTIWCESFSQYIASADLPSAT